MGGDGASQKEGWAGPLLPLPNSEALSLPCASTASCVISPQALSILMLPHNIPPSLNLLTSMVDDMWHYAGDQSTDVSALLRPAEDGDGWVKHFLPKFVKFL